jgi:phospholipase/carboxylesterase
MKLIFMSSLLFIMLFLSGGMAMDYQNATFKSRPHSATDELSPGLHTLNLADAKDGLIYVPRERNKSHPLLVLFHGAGGKASQMLVPFRDLAEETGTVLLIPESRRQSWDVIHGGFGPDVEFIDKALNLVFNKLNIDPAHLGVGGFSDGASYALSVGISNGDMFSLILAFSPGFMAPPVKKDSPPVFISHGDKDGVLNIDQCSRRLVPSLRKNGLHVTYHEFKGGHTLPEEIIKEAFGLFVGFKEEKLNNTRTPVNEKEIRKT